MKIDVWTDNGKVSVLVDDCLSVTTKGSDFYAKCAGDVNGSISLDSLNAVLERKPAIIDEKALELREMREKLRILLG